MNSIFGSPDLPRFDSEGAARMYAAPYVPLDEPLCGAAIARAARRLADSNPVLAARLERAAQVVICSPTFKTLKR